jgi:hypothetical protein
MDRCCRAIYISAAEPSNGTFRVTFKDFQCQFRPFIDRAWVEECRATGIPPNNKTAKDRWYRNFLWSVSTIRTTKAIANDHEAQKRLLAAARAAAEMDAILPSVLGWTDKQNERYLELATAAWKTSCSSQRLESWVADQISDIAPNFIAADKTESFDRAMTKMALIADDHYWLTRCSVAEETRLRFLIGRQLREISRLTGRLHGWAYVRKMMKQARHCPDQIDDATADQLKLAFEILDTYRRRLSSRIADRPSRTRMNNK